MCLYMNVPLWINVERLTAAVSTTASHLFDVSLVIFLLNCKSTKSAAVATAKANAATTQQIARLECKQLNKQQQQQQQHQQQQYLQQQQYSSIKTSAASLSASPATNYTDTDTLHETTTNGV